MRAVLVDAMLSQFTDTAKSLGIRVTGDVAAWRGYAAERMLFLSSITGEKGFQEAVATEAFNIALLGAEKAVGAADEIDAGLWGIVAGGLVVGARALAVVV